MADYQTPDEKDFHLGRDCLSQISFKKSPPSNGLTIQSHATKQHIFFKKYFLKNLFFNKHVHLITIFFCDKFKWSAALR